MTEYLRKKARDLMERGFLRYLRFTEQTLEREIQRNAILMAQMLLMKQKQNGDVQRIREAEFRVFSQFGEDGIIQYLIDRVAIENDTFIEFGVEDYTEANTKFLLTYNNWRGLVIDGAAAMLQQMHRDQMYRRHELKAVQSFITVDNINQLFLDSGFSGDIGLLSIDIDGNDYWVWKAVDVVSPRIVVCEYNSLFGPRYPVTVPYRPDFRNTKAHYSNLYFGASLPALCHLANEKGYCFVGSNSTGHNAFFVRKDVIGTLRPRSVEEEYVVSRFRSSVNEAGALTFLSGRDRIRTISELEVVDVITGVRRKVGDLHQ